ncbi:hypothetical protein ACFXP3_04690 [Streptomyces sp. NPDC059096]|uniref:hypothetical protein n=1 Tax=Streptomyces sp. NPDC059096 TaxID=3346727 RepID=UPI0036951391
MCRRDRIRTTPTAQPTYRSVAEIAPPLGISGLPVTDAHWYTGITGLDVTEQAA